MFLLSIVYSNNFEVDLHRYFVLFDTLCLSTFVCTSDLFSSMFSTEKKNIFSNYFSFIFSTRQNKTLSLFVGFYININCSIELFHSSITPKFHRHIILFVGLKTLKVKGRLPHPSLKYPKGSRV